MKNLGLATIAATGLMAAILGFAGPAQADIGHHDWVYDIQPTSERAAGRHGRAPEPLTNRHEKRAPGKRVPSFRVPWDSR